MTTSGHGFLQQESTASDVTASVAFLQPRWRLHGVVLPGLSRCVLFRGSLPEHWQSFPQGAASLHGPHGQGAERTPDALGVELVGFWVARGTVHDQNNFKRQSLTGKVLSDIRDKTSMASIQKKGSPRPGLLTVQPADGQLALIFRRSGEQPTASGSPDPTRRDLPFLRRPPVRCSLLFLPKVRLAVLPADRPLSPHLNRSRSHPH